MEQYPNNPQSSGNSAGCWLIAIISGFIAMILVIVALFLPPFNLYTTLVGSPYTLIKAQGEAIPSADGAFTLAAATDVDGEYGVRVETTTLQNFEAGSSSAGEWIPVARNAVPYYLALQSPVYSVESVGTEPENVFLSVQTPNNIINPDLLDLYGWYGDDTSGEWRFIPSSKTENQLETFTGDIPRHIAIFQAAPDIPEVLVTYDVTKTLTAEVASVASIVAPGGLQPSRDGMVRGSLAAGSDANANYRLMPVIRNFDDRKSVV